MNGVIKEGILLIPVPPGLTEMALGEDYISGSIE